MTFRTELGRLIRDSQEQLFTDIDERRAALGIKPSEVERMLDQEEWGMGDMWRDWWHESGDKYE